MSTNDTTRAQQEIPAMPSTWGASNDDFQWEKEAKDLSHTALAGIRKTATAWAGTISVLLGVFSTVAFIKGPSTFTDLKADWAAALAASLIVTAALLAGAAILFAALAAQGTPRWLTTDGWTLKNAAQSQAATASKQLTASRWLAVLAALGVIAGVSVTWFETLGEPSPAPKAQPALVKFGTTVRCGALTVDTNGDLLFAIGNKTPVPLAKLNGTDVTPVAACPPKG